MARSSCCSSTPATRRPVCTKQFCSYRDTGLEDLGATVVGISAQDLKSHKRFTEHHGLTVPLLADENKKVAKKYNVAVPMVGTRRATFVIDEEGVVRFKHVNRLGLDYMDADDLRKAVEQATTAKATASPGRLRAGARARSRARRASAPSSKRSTSSARKPSMTRREATSWSSPRARR